MNNQYNHGFDCYEFISDKHKRNVLLKQFIYPGASKSRIYTSEKYMKNNAGITAQTNTIQSFNNIILNIDWESYSPNSGYSGVFSAQSVIPGLNVSNSYIQGMSLRTYGSVFGYIGGEANISAML